MLSAIAGRMPAELVASKSGLPLDSVLSFAQSLKEKGLISLSQQSSQNIALTAEGRRFAEQGLPELRVLACALSGKPISSLSQEEKAIGLPWAAKNGWVKIERGALVAQLASPPAYPQQQALKAVLSGQAASAESLELLSKRKLAVETTSRQFFLEKTGKKYDEAAQEESAVNAISREMLLSGAWKSAQLRPYDVSAPAETPFPAKRHAISRLQKKIARIFTDMGFEQMEGPETQSSFWNFDALFQPQDHPARELADTFYLKGESPLPLDASLVAKVKREHEKSWGGSWLEKNARKTVLRTHTTALSARYLHEKCQGKAPKKYFAIGKVYRNEATDYKHLAEFFQVEGIVVWEGATFRDLLGCLKEFYRKLGFTKIRFQPSYFPYTEPSLEISVFFEKKQQWLELGGAGIFRPEVSIPLCGRYPVLAWGLSLERPLMLLNEMDDIRAFYKSNVGWIRKQKV